MNMEKININDMNQIQSGYYIVSDEINNDFEINLIQNNQSKNLIVYFAPAVNITGLKYFPKFYKIDCTENLLCVCDNFYKKIQINPTSKYNPTKPPSVAGWYVFIQKSLEKLINNIQNTFNYEKIIFIGGSSGGFASLYYSFRIQNSIAIAINPQTDISYNLNKLKELGVDFSTDPFSCITNMNTLYQNGFNNNIIYVVNNMSPSDMQKHTIPFMTTLYNTPNFKHNVILKSDFWGKHNHGSSIPNTEYMKWIQACVNSPTIEVQDISDAYWNLTINNKGGRHE